MSHLGIWEDEVERGTLWCLLASLFAAWTFSSQAQQSAASSAQHSTLASAASHTLHWIFITANSHLTNCRNPTPTRPITLQLPLHHRLGLREETWEWRKIWGGCGNRRQLLIFSFFPLKGVPSFVHVAVFSRVLVSVHWRPPGPCVPLEG